jgi:integrative and conjugative element protein (TIGR02256 family)
MARVWPFAGSDRLLEISDAAWKIFAEHAQKAPSAYEAGGILLGRVVATNGHFVVDQAAPPNSRDRRSRFSFRRSRRASQGLVDEAWHQSCGTCIYLGEWHTHPEDDPWPSSTDRADRIRLLVQTKCEQDRLIFVIVGRTLVRVWEGSRSTMIVNEVGTMPTAS